MEIDKLCRIIFGLYSVCSNFKSANIVISYKFSLLDLRFGSMVYRNRLRNLQLGIGIRKGKANSYGII